MNQLDARPATSGKISGISVSGNPAWAALVFSAAILGLTACSNPPKTDQQLQQQAAQTTQEVKQDAKEAAANAKVAAAKAERKVNDIAAGVKEGLHNDKPAPGTPNVLDINSASANQLSGLPGITRAQARHIVESRPYGSKYDLVRKGVISEDEYERISGSIVAQ